MIAFLKSFQLQPNPFRFLLYTEWALLGSCGSLAVVEAFQGNHLPVQHVAILLTLWFMGLMLPTGKAIVKLLYTSIQLGLIFYGALLGYLHILPLLYLIVVIRSCFIFNPLGRWAIAVCSFFLFLVHQIHYVYSVSLLVEPAHLHHFWMHLVGETLMFGLGLFLVLRLASVLLSERRVWEQLAIAHQKLQKYARQSEDLAVAQERNHIAREIHDSLGHALTALNVQLQTAVKLWTRAPERAVLFLEQAQQLGITAMQEVRKSVGALREQDERETLSLQDEIKALVEKFEQVNEISTSAYIDCDIALPAQVARTIYRILQEALTNVAKHAEATVVEIQLQATSESLFLEVQDDGRGFCLDKEPVGFGLRGMQERVAALKGEFQIESELESGCCITVKLPLVRHDSSVAGGRPEPYLPRFQSHAGVGAGLANRRDR